MCENVYIGVNISIKMFMYKYTNISIMFMHKYIHM